jgi:CheY-like chemotaxis protein
VVKDDGCGIKQDIIDSIFEPFFTTKEKGKGTGMGLSMVHGIVTGYGGSIALESKEGVGTTFTLYFPLLDIETPQENVDELPTLQKGTGRVLFVDDEQNIVDMAQQMLEFLGYDTTCFTSSSEALEVFKQNPNGFDIVITDQSMPKMTGIQLTEKLLEIRADIPVILATGYSSVVNQETIELYGIKAFLMKPHTVQKLSSTIQEVLSLK